MIETDIQAELAALLFEESGINTAISFLFKHIKKTFPITRLFVNFRSVETFAIIPIAQVHDSNHNEITESTEGSDYYTLTTELSPQDIIYIKNVKLSSLTREYMSKLDNTHKSILSIPFFKNGDNLFCIGIASDVEQGFSKEAVDNFVKLFSPLAKAVEKDFVFNPKIITKSLMVDDSIQFLQYKGLKNVWDNVNKVASTTSTVLINGETGVGKEVVADAIHSLSQFKNGPFVKINCGAIPESLIINELFGHEKGSFTGAISAEMGYFEKANNGTIFLDEIGELNLNAQVYLLRVIERKEIQRVGSSTPRSLNVRIIAATNRDLESMVNNGQFRKDLWYRLLVYPIDVPPLRKRRIDIIPLVNFFIEKKSVELGLNCVPKISEEEISRLCAYDWPGNVRQLSLVVEKALVSARSGNIVKPLHFGVPNEETTCPSDIPKAWENAPTESLPSLKKIEQQYIKHVLFRTNGKIEGDDGAAKILDMNPSTLRSLMRRLKIK